MNVVSKPLTLMLVVLLLSSLLVLSVTPVNALTMSKLSVPQFSVKQVSSGIEVTIKNQPFTSTSEYIDVGYGYETVEYNLYYLVEFKNHFAEEWKNFGAYTIQSNSGYTTVYGYENNYAVGSQWDFKVTAAPGYLWQPYGDRYYLPIHYEVRFLASEGSCSSSNSQTITITAGTSFAQPSQTAIPPQNPVTTPENNQLPTDKTQLPNFVFHRSFLLWIATFLFVGIIVTVVLVFLKRHLKTPNYNSHVYNP